MSHLNVKCLMESVKANIRIGIDEALETYSIDYHISLIGNERLRHDVSGTNHFKTCHKPLCTVTMHV